MIPIELRLLAHRYLYYVLCTPIISDYEYDLLERDALASTDIPPDSPMREPGSDQAQSYSQEVKRYAEDLAQSL